MRSPPGGTGHDPRIELWPAGREIVRVHPAVRGPREFSRTSQSARFRPVRAGGRPLGSLYGAAGVEAALSETVFHDVPVAGPGRVVPLAAVADRLLTRLRPRRDLALIELHGFGLRRLGLRRAEVIDTPAASYPQTAALAQDLYERCPAADGIVWMSRQLDSQRALLLWSGRVRARDLEPLGVGPPLGFGRGLVVLAEAAEGAGIAVLFG